MNLAKKIINEAIDEDDTPQGRYRMWQGFNNFGNGPVRIYRTTPEGDDSLTIIPGDWVSANIEYVKEYGGDGARIITATTDRSELTDAETGALPGDTLIFVPKNPNTTLQAKLL